jgi:DNA-binding transcriptional MerR regulator
MWTSVVTTERTYGISELAHEFGITARAIRFYEDRGLIAPSRKGLRRVFSARDRVRLMLILRGKRLGFALREIQDILDLYDTRTGETKQLAHMVDKIQERRESLIRQREDIDLTLREIDRLEDQFRSLLGGDGDGDI